MKAVSEIIAAVMIVAITIGLTSTAYIWGAPLIEKRQQASVTERVFEQFNQRNSNSLPKLIEDIANNRGTRTFTINSDGTFKLNETEDSIEFMFVSKTSNVAPDQQFPISLTPGVQCSPTPSPSNGTQGFDSASVVCSKAKTETAGYFTMSYKIYFRELYDNPFSSTATGFKIDLTKDPSGLETTTGKTVRMTFVDSSTQNLGGRTLITKQIKILLI